MGFVAGKEGLAPVLAGGGEHRAVFSGRSKSRLFVDKEGGLPRREMPPRWLSKTGRVEGGAKFRRASATTYSSSMHSWPHAWISSTSRRMALADLPAEKRMLASRKTRIGYGVARDGFPLRVSPTYAHIILISLPLLACNLLISGQILFGAPGPRVF